MSYLKEKLTTNWHPMRMIKLAFGVWAMVQAFQVHDYIIGILGAFFLYQAVTDTGCCGAQGCNTRIPRTRRTDEVVTEYEEIK